MSRKKGLQLPFFCCLVWPEGQNVKKCWAPPGFEPGTSRTLSENHTPRPKSQSVDRVVEPKGHLAQDQEVGKKREAVPCRDRTGDLARVKGT